jgi:hypothetical protein
MSLNLRKPSLLGRQIHERVGLTACAVTDDVFESEAAIVAASRVHTIKGHSRGHAGLTRRRA